MITSLADEVAESHSSDCEEADELLRQITIENRRPKHAELVFFRRHMNWDERAVQQQLRRMHNVVRDQSIAGTADDRQATRDNANEAAAVLDKEAPKLEKKIHDLQTQLESLRRDAKLSATRQADQAQAVQRLRELVPQHIRDAVNHEICAVKSTIGRELSDCEIRINELECCLNPSRYGDETLWLETLQRSFPKAVSLVSEGRGRIESRKLSPEWPSIREGIEAELSELRPKLAELKKQFQTAMKQAEAPLCFYAR